MSTKNWFGKEMHPTDQYLYCSWKMTNEELNSKAEKYRKAYDLLASVDKEALELLLEAAYDTGKHDEWEMNNGD